MNNPTPSRSRAAIAVGVSLVIACLAGFAIGKADSQSNSWFVRRMAWAKIFFFHIGEWDFRYSVKLQRDGEDIAFSERITCENWVAHNPAADPNPVWYESARAVSDRRSGLVAIVPALCALNSSFRSSGAPINLPANAIPLIATADDADDPQLLTAYLSPTRLYEGVSGLKLIAWDFDAGPGKTTEREAISFGKWAWPSLYVDVERHPATESDIFPFLDPWRFNGIVAKSVARSDWMNDRVLAERLKAIEKPTILSDVATLHAAAKLFGPFASDAVDLDMGIGATAGITPGTDIFADAFPFRLQDGVFVPDFSSQGTAALYPARNIQLDVLRPLPASFMFEGELLTGNVRSRTVLFDPKSDRLFSLRIVAANWRPLSWTEGE